MTFAATERRYYEPDFAIDCACDRGGDDCTCEQDAQDAYEATLERRAEDAADAAIDAEQARREDHVLDGPEPGWEP